MASYNRIILVGNLTRDPVLRYLPSGGAVVEIGLACNHRYKTKQGEDREDALFIDCAAFGKQAEIINQYCQKGKPLLVEGRVKYDVWDDKQGGGKRSKHSVVIDNFQLLGGKGGDGSAEDQTAETPRERIRNRPAPTNPIPENAGFADGSDPIPF